MKGYTAIEGALTAEVPLASYMLYNEFKAERRRLLPEVLRPVLRQGHLREAGRSSSRCSTRAEPWPTPPPPSPRPGARPATPPGRRAEALRLEAPAAVRRPAACCSSSGTSSSALGFIKPILLPTPAATLGALVTGLAGGPLLHRLRGHGAAHAAGVPDRRGDRRAARRAARQQREGVPQRRVPDRLLPLDAVVGADPAVPADLRRLRHQQGRDRRVRRLADRASSTAPTASSTRASSASWRRG